MKMVAMITRNTPKQLLLALKYDGYSKLNEVFKIEYKAVKNVRNNMPIYTAIIKLR